MASYRRSRSLLTRMIAPGVLCCFSGEHLRDDNGVGVHAINDAPSLRGVLDSEFVAVVTDARHWSGMGHSHGATSLELPKQKTGLDPRFRRERWRLDLAAQPHQRLVLRGHIR